MKMQLPPDAQKLLYFFVDNKPLARVVGPEAPIPIDPEVKQVQAGVLWTMFTAVKDTLSLVKHVPRVSTRFARLTRAPHAFDCGTTFVIDVPPGGKVKAKQLYMCPCLSQHPRRTIVFLLSA